MYDVFISYRRDGGFEMARLLYDHLKLIGLNPFFDLEELSAGQFNEKLYTEIKRSANFLLVLHPNSLERCKNEDDWVRLEIECALKESKNIVPVMINDFVWPEELPASLQKLPYFNGVKISREYFDASIARLLSMLKGVEVMNGAVVKSVAANDVRTQNTYFIFEDDKEKRRLKIQQDLMREFDLPVYNGIKERYDRLYILDVGSNNGDFIMDRIANSDKLEKLIGLEYDSKTVQAANLKYGKENKIAFYELDVEDGDFAENLEKITEQQGVEQFNVINLSMVLLHIKAPFKLLKALRKFLSDDGVLVIKDIDDGFNLAYPDEKGEFARVMEICKKNDTSGFRESGRQIFTFLNRSGYKKVTLEKQGLSTVGMDYEQRSALFDTYFSFIMEDLKIMRERYPNDEGIKRNYDWYKNIYDDLEERFQDDAFFFSLGFMIFTAQKR